MMDFVDANPLASCDGGGKGAFDDKLVYDFDTYMIQYNWNKFCFAKFFYNKLIMYFQCKIEFSELIKFFLKCVQ